MSIFAALILGLVQGLTEFLPVSSSGHLVLFQNIFGIEGDLLFFDTMLHVGTLIAVVYVLWDDVVAIFKNILGARTWQLVLATIPAVIAAVLLEDLISDAFEGKFLGVGFLLTTVFLTLSEKLFERRRAKHMEITYPIAGAMGVMQAVAIVPGISRSGSTLSAGLAMGTDRSVATKFSFLMTIPVILGSVVLQGYDLVKTGAGQVAVLPTIVGVIAAAAAGFFAVKVMLQFMKEKKLYGFAIYTAILGAIVLLDQLVLHIVF